MFCYCYDGFCGDVCMHHGPSFEVAEFFSCGYGVFPTTLMAIALPLLAVSFAAARSSE